MGQQQHGTENGVMRNGIISPPDSIASSNSSLNVQSVGESCQTLPFNGANPQKQQADLHSYANRLKSSLANSNGYINKEVTENAPQSTEPLSKPSSKQVNSGNETSVSSNKVNTQEIPPKVKGAAQA